MAKPGKKGKILGLDTLGGRMRAAADSAGMSSRVIAEGLAQRLGGLTDAAVRKWWRGDNEPPIEAITAYAEVVGASPVYLLLGLDESGNSLYAWARRFADLIDQGIEADAAIETLTGTGLTEDQALRDLGMTEEERRLLAGSTEGMRAILREMSGKPWADLTEDEKLDVLLRIDQRAQQNERIRQIREAGAE